MRRTVFYISDGTGITAETIGHSVLTQFEGVRFDTLRIPFVDTPKKAEQAVERIRAVAESNGERPIVVNTVIDENLSRILAGSGALMLDVFAPFLSPLERELGVERKPLVGRAHGVTNTAEYEKRISATNYALAHDDGMDPNYHDADVILVGVSRSGKTPTCLYMALHFGVAAANYPLTEEDLAGESLPSRLQAHRDKLFGLTIDPDRLQQIRNERRPDSRYAQLAQCRTEVRLAEQLFRQEQIPHLNTTHTSIEEIGSKVLAQLGIEKQLY
ncbi:MAG TPA: pyruvate, water dikinase regulatory protein [Xanthomonadaceae bacterium]|nr:pyruvate, water dikinase regulatory protein [Xanthomonadaceae bacterium]